MFTKLKKKIEEENQTELNIGVPVSTSSPTPTHTRRVAPEGNALVTPTRSTCSEASDSDKEQRPKTKPQSHDTTTANSDSRSTRGSVSRRSEPPYEYQELCRKLHAVQKAKEEAEARLVEAQQKIERLACQAENSEELESFQSQEMAKIKHLLLCSQQDVRATEQKVRLQEEECRLAREEVARLQAQLQEGTRKSIVADLQAEKEALIQEVDLLKQEALQSSGRISQMEAMLGNLTDQYDGLKHTHDVYKAKAAALSEETSSTISHLNEKVRTLEKRLEDSSLTGDEQVQSLIEERCSLEKKLDESRQHLSEVKSSWSEKINSLEAQILNLNQKMAEDGQECSRLDRALAETTSKHRDLEEKHWKLEEKLQEKERNLSALQQARDEELERLRSGYTVQLEELRSQLATVRGELAQTYRERDRAMREADARKVEHQKKESESQLHMQELESSLQASAEKVSKLEGEVDSLSRDLQEKATEMDKLSREVIKLKAHNTSLSVENNELTQRLREMQKRPTADKGTSPETAAEPSTDLSVEELQKRLHDLESQMLEKHKTIRLQQQRIADMKKTLQRELKFQQGSEPGSQVQSGSQEGDRLVSAATEDNTSGAAQVERKLENDINFKYLKHVVFKFMTSTEYEAQHLIRAVSVLLHFTDDEEQLIREHLDWKTSWFGIRPHHTHHQPHHPQRRHPQRHSTHLVSTAKSHSKHGPG